MVLEVLVVKPSRSGCRVDGVEVESDLTDPVVESIALRVARRRVPFEDRNDACASHLYTDAFMFGDCVSGLDAADASADRQSARCSRRAHRLGGRPGMSRLREEIPTSVRHGSGRTSHLLRNSPSTGHRDVSPVLSGTLRTTARGRPHQASSAPIHGDSECPALGRFAETTSATTHCAPCKMRSRECTSSRGQQRHAGFGSGSQSARRVILTLSTSRVHPGIRFSKGVPF